MKTTLISKEKNVAKFTMEFTAEEFEGAVIKAYQATKDKFTVDGFRKGKAPRKLIETHYGEDIFFEDAINNIFSDSYPKALDELGLDIIDRPSADFSDLKKGEGFTVTIEVECYPEIEVKDYKGVEIEKVEHPVTDEDVDRELEVLRKRNARMVLVEREAREGDTLLIDYAGFVGDEQFEGGTAERYALQLGSNTFIPGFEDQLVGAVTGEEREVKVTFPEEYHSDELAGKEAVFKCKVHEIKEEELPEINDDFAKDVSEFDTIEELKADAKEKIEKAAAARAENEMKNSVIEKVYNANEFDAPPVMVEDEINARIGEMEQQLRYQGLELSKYMEYMQQDLQGLKDSVREDCTKAVKTRILVGAVAEAEGITADEADIKEQLDMMAQQYKLDAEKIREMLGAENMLMVEKDIKMRKAIDFMFDNAVIK